MVKKRFSVSKWFTNDWVITIISTMIGVIAGLYLTNYNEDHKLKNAQQTAFDMVSKELRNNKKALEAYDSICELVYLKSNYVFSIMDEDKKIILQKDSVEVFKTKAEGIISNLVIEALPYPSDSVRLRGEMDLYLNSKLAVLDLNNVIWESYKQTDFLNVTNFECVIALEELYQFQTNYNEVNRRWVNMLTEGRFLMGTKELDEFMLLWQKLLGINEILLNMYDQSETDIADCI